MPPPLASPDGDHRSAALHQAFRNRGQNVDLAQFVSRNSSLSTTQLAELVRIDQSERWERGERPLVEKYCVDFPTIGLDAEAVTDIAYHEFLLREAYSESTELESFLARFPDYEAALRDQIMFHVALRNSAQQTAWLEEITGGSADSVDP